MSTPKNVTKTSPVAPMSQAAVYGDRAITVMGELHVLPTPTHYSIFFAYAAGQPSGIVKEIDKAMDIKRPLTDEFLEYLHATYIGEPQAQAMHDTAVGAKRILSEIMQNVSKFSGQTSELSRDVAKQLQGMDENASEDMVRLLAQTLIEGAQTIQDSSETMAQRLASAQAEIAALRDDLARSITESDRDFLTGAFNRKAFDRRLNESMLLAREEKTELTLLMLDIDHFKQFNDNFGHLVGDEVLKIVAKTLIDTLKGMDCVARFGGEEFAVILPNTPVGGGMIVAEIIRKSIAGKELKRKHSGENYGQITVSIGVANFNRHDDSPASFVARADEALYRSKNAGRNRVTQETLG